MRNVKWYGMILPLLLASCLDVETMNITLFPDPGNVYEGRARVEFINIHSTEKEPGKNKKDMEEFFNEYREYAVEISSSMGLRRQTNRLVNKKELSTDAEIEGEFEHLAATLVWLLEKSQFRMEGSDGQFSFYRKNPLTEEGQVNLVIVYPGKIVAHNSASFDAKTGTMRWSLNKAGDREISFTIAASPSP